MWLYRQTTQCHPEYWCLILMKSKDVEQENITHSTTTIPIASDRSPLQYDLTKCLQNIPKPPDNYPFSLHQGKEQCHTFLHAKIDPEKPPTLNAVLYHMAIVAVLPNSCSTLLQYFIESLFITHAECKLNEIGHLTNPPAALISNPPSYLYNQFKRPPSISLI